MAVNVAYYSCGRLWLAVAFIVEFFADIAGSLNSVGWYLPVPVFLCVAAMCFRTWQARRSYPHRIVFERGWRQHGAVNRDR
jgi:hypothetical protein